MLVDLPPGFEAAAHAGDVFEAVFQKVSDGSKAAVAVAAAKDDFAVLIRACDEFLHVPVMQMNGSGNVRRPVADRGLRRAAILLALGLAGIAFIAALAAIVPVILR